MQNKIKQSAANKTLSAFAYVLLTIGSIICVLPFIVIVSGSFTDNATIITKGYSLLPKNFTTAAYQTIFRSPKDIIQAYKMNFYYTGIGTFLGLMMITLTGYVISRKEFKYRNTVSFLIYFTSIFGGGMIPWYLMYANVLNLKGHTLAIWFPALMSPFLVILMRTFIVGAVPDAITESAKIDGAGHFTIFFKIVLPLSKAALASIGLMYAVTVWNDYSTVKIYITDPNQVNFQYKLRNMVMDGDTPTTSYNVSQSTLYNAGIVMAILPFMVLYPFLQKYFVQGVNVGAVKE